MLDALSVSIVVEDVPKISLSKDLPSEISLINHPKKIYKKIELSNSTLSPNCILKCSIVSVVLSTQESLKLDPQKIEEADFPHKEFKETLQESL